MVDAHAITHLSDGLVPGLNYGPAGNTAEYVQSSKLVKIRPEAGDRYSPGAARVIRFRLVDDGWLNRARVQLTINNMTKKADGTGENLTPLAPPICMFESCRLFLGGQVVEQIDELGPLGSIADYLKPTVKRIRESTMEHTHDGTTRTTLPANASRRVVFELPFGMFRQHRWLPLHTLSQLVVELTLGPVAHTFNKTTANFS